jgi:hypothetical protein
MSTSIATAQTADPRPTALFIVELLELILSHLDLHDALWNAQRVNKFWASCIQNSPLLSQKFFLRLTPITLGADPLFLHFKSPVKIDMALAPPELTRVYDRIRTFDNEGESDSGEGAGENDFTLRSLARALSSNKISPIEYSDSCSIFLGTLQRQCRRRSETALEEFQKEVSRFRLNGGALIQMNCGAYQLDTDFLHPFFLEMFGEAVHCMTGFADHLVMMFQIGVGVGVGVWGREDAQTELEFALAAFNNLLKSESKGRGGGLGSWRTSMVTKPGVKKITVVACGYGGIKTWFRCSYVCNAGVTIGKTFELIMRVTEESFLWLDPYGNGGRSRASEGRRVPVMSERKRAALRLISEIRSRLGNEDEGFEEVAYCK